jgi:putative membrane protein
MMADSNLQRTHPATVAVRTGQTLWQIGLWLVGLVVFGTLGSGGRAIPSLIAAAVIAFGVLVLIASKWISWWRFGYGIVDKDLIIEEGWLVRKRRTIPIARVHGVNVKADLFMRMLGLVELVVQTAGGGADEPEAKIGAIPLDRAEALRNALLLDMPETPAEQSAGFDPVGRISDFRGAFGGTEVRGREVRFEHKIPFGRLLLGEVTSNRIPILFAVALGVLGQLYEFVDQRFVDQTASRAAEIALPLLFVLLVAAGALLVVVAAAIGVARDFGFTARRYETRIETESGLFERRQISMPVGRIQAVRIEESWLRRLLGLATIQVDTAGLERSGQQEGQLTASKAMVPVARTADVAALMHGLLPEAEDFPEAHGLPSRALRFYLLLPTSLVTIGALAALGPASWYLYRPALPWAMGVVAIAALITVGLRTLQWRRAGIGTDEVAVTLRSGALGVKHVRLTRSRIQSLDVRQNPFQRRAGLASLKTVSVSGSSQASYGVSHVEEAEALRIMRWYEQGLPRPRSVRADGESGGPACM